MNFFSACGRAGAAVFFCSSLSLAQTPPLETPPDLSNKALITTKQPAPPDSAAKPGEAHPVKQYTIEQFMDTTKIGGDAFTHDEKAVLFHSNKSGIYNVYRQPIAGGEPTQLTHSKKESTFVVTAFPEDARFLYSYDKGGNENAHLYLQELDGTERDLTPGDKTKAQFLKWSTDRKSFFFATNARDPKYFDVFEMKLADLKPVLIYENKTGYDFADITDDRRYIAFGKSGATTADSDMFLYDTETKEMKNLAPHQGNVQNQPQTFGADGKQLYFLSDAGEEFLYLARYTIASGEREVVEKAKWDIVSFSFSRTGKYQVTLTNEDARTKVRIVESATGQPVELPALPPGDVNNVTISDSETQMAFYHNSPRSPNNLYVYNLQSRKLAKLTDTLSKAIDPTDLVESKVVRYKSFDGLEIPAILYQPHGASAEHKLPALVFVHGGPGGQARLPYSAVAQYLANHGYVILDVNNRGSSGYGKTFFTADDRKHGREPLWDCVAAKQFLYSLGYVAPDRVGIMGGSYGGYMVLAALAFKPEEFAVGVDIFGVSNWVRTLQSIPPWWEAQRASLYAEIGDPGKDLEMLREISPLFHADKITKPLIVLQGKNDPRVLKAESDEVVAAIKQKKGVVDYVVFDNEGHGFTKKENELHAYKAILDFLDKYLKGTSPSS